MKLNRAAHDSLFRPGKVNRPNSVGAVRDRDSTGRLAAFIPFLALGYVLIFVNLLVISVPGEGTANDPAPNIGNRVFWPGLLFLTLALAVRYRSRFSWDFLRAPAIAGLVAYMILAGASIAWAFSPEHAINRYLFQMMLVTAVILPFAIEPFAADTLRKIYIWYALAIVINVVWLLFERPQLTEAGAVFGYRGYFTFKGYLGECASVAILISLYELRSSGWRRLCALALISVSIWVVFMSNSKGSLAFAILAPVLAAPMLVASNRLRVPVNAIVAIIVGLYFLASSVSSNLVGNIAYDFYGDSSLTGRTIIWDFIQGQISRNPWFGWGFHSFWLVGPTSPSVTEAPDWVRHMTGSHSGYLDVKLETGYFGYALLIFFILATVHAIARVARTDLFRAWILLSLVLFIALTNLLETVWFQNDPLWVVFLLVAADATRYRNSKVDNALKSKARNRITPYNLTARKSAPS